MITTDDFRQLRHRLALCWLMLCLLFTPVLAYAQQQIWVTGASSSSISIAWTEAQGAGNYDVSYRDHGPESEETAGSTSGTSFRIGGLEPDTEYEIFVDYSISDYYQITARTRKTGSDDVRTENKVSKRDVKETKRKPMPVTCRHLPPFVVVSGDVVGTQCQLVGQAGVGQMPLIKRGVIHAVDIWNIVPSEIDVCIRGEGWLAILDADYSPRMIMELEHSYRDGMTCGTIDRAGTVVLLAAGPPPNLPVTQLPAKPDAQPAVETLPTFEAIPLAFCQIKLVETLFLRAEPAGEIMGIVWLNSEVTALAISGYWYKVEFEGKTGYISRYHRRVLRGGCG